MVVQMARAIGARVATTAGSDEKIAKCRKLGAEPINYHVDDFAKVIRDKTTGVDLILDPVGGSYLEKNLGYLTMDGRLVLIAVMGGRAATIDLGKLRGNTLFIGDSVLQKGPEVEQPLITEINESHPALRNVSLRNVTIGTQTHDDTICSGGTPFHLETLDVVGLPPGLHLPPSELKELFAP